MRLNVSEAVRHWAKKDKGTVAISGEYVRTYEQLNRNVNGLAEQIVQCFGSRKRIGILSKKKYQFIVALISLIRTNNVFVLINPNLSGDQIEKCLDAGECDGIITCENYDVNSRFPCINLPVDGDALLLSSKELFPDQYSGTEDIGGVLFTSGTTGIPKGLIRTNYSLLSEAILWMVELSLSQKVSFFIPRPLYNTTGFVLLYATLFAGGRTDIFDSISAEGILEYFAKTKCEWALLVPSTIREILYNYSDSHGQTFDKVLTIGESISAEAKLEFAKRFSCSVYESWGNSEGLGTITEASMLYSAPKSAGRPFFTDRVEIIKIESDETADVNEVGRICGYSDNEFSEYINNSELTEKVISSAGRIFSSDLGYMDADGQLYVMSRSDDVIITDGINVYPSDIEKVATLISEISDCVVLGIKNKVSEVPIAIIQLSKATNAKEACIMEKINIKLAQHEKIHHVLFVEKVPRNENGKVNKNAIKERHASNIRDLPGGPYVFK